MLVPTLGGDAVGSDAAAGGADRRSAKNAAAPRINRAKRTTRPGRSTPPRGIHPRTLRTPGRPSMKRPASPLSRP